MTSWRTGRKTMKERGRERETEGRERRIPEHKGTRHGEIQESRPQREREREREKVDPHHARFTLKASALGLLEIRAFVLSYDPLDNIYIYIYICNNIF